MRSLAWILATSLGAALCGAAHGADGLSARATASTWPAYSPYAGASMIGDYYFMPMALPGTAGGFRATSGVVRAGRTAPLAGTPALTGLRGLGLERSAPAWDGTEPATLPYLGFGYSGAALRGGWSFSADVGLLALNPGPAVRFGRVFTGAQTFDDLMRELRLAPVVQLGVSYAF